MTRRMSVSMTVDAVRDRSKRVTRRHVDTWKNLKPGDRLTLIEKGMGLAKGEKQVVLAEVEIVSVRVEPIWLVTSDVRYGRQECAIEGFPEMTPEQFVGFWLKGHGYHGYCRDADGMPYPIECRRIEWRYLSGECPECRNQFEGRMPGHVYGSNWDFVPCRACNGVGFASVPEETS